MKEDMGHDRQVLLVFIQADSGVDGTSLLNSASSGHSVLNSLKDSLLSNVIRRAQFAIPPLALMILSSQKVPGVNQTICDLRFEKFLLTVTGILSVSASRPGR